MKLTYLMHNVPSEAQANRPQRFIMIPECIHVNQPWCRYQQGEHVAQGHRHENHIRRRSHVPFAQHYDYQGIRNYRDNQQKG